MGFWIIIGVFALLGMYVQNKLKSKFKKYSLQPLSSGMSGKEIAEAMLQHYGITDVQVIQGEGRLTDHYNPQTKIVALSPEVYQGRSVAAASVAAHECGHAVQHDTQYSMLQMRSGIVPIVKIAASAQQYLLIGALFFMGSFPQLLLIAIIAFTVTTLFSLITLPVEFDASRRALAWLDETGIARPGPEYDGAKDALHWAAMTYVVAALSAIAMLLYLVLNFASR